AGEGPVEQQREAEPERVRERDGRRRVDDRHPQCVPELVAAELVAIVVEPDPLGTAGDDLAKTDVEEALRDVVQQRVQNREHDEHDRRSEEQVPGVQPTTPPRTAGWRCGDLLASLGRGCRHHGAHGAESASSIPDWAFFAASAGSLEPLIVACSASWTRANTSFE